MSKPLIIFGTGSMARVLHSFMRHQYNTVAFCADDEFLADPSMHNFTHDLPQIPRSALSWKYKPKNHCMAIACGYHQMNRVRQARFEEFKNAGYEMVGYVNHLIAPHLGIALGTGVVIYDGVALHAGSAVRDNAFISSNVSIGHDCVIGDHAWINSGAVLGGGVWVGARCVLGMNCTIAQHVKLGEGTYVGANTLVTHDTLPNSVIVADHGQVIDMNSERFLKLTRQP